MSNRYPEGNPLTDPSFGNTQISDDENAVIDAAQSVNKIVNNSSLNLDLAKLTEQANQTQDPSLAKAALNELAANQPTIDPNPSISDVKATLLANTVEKKQETVASVDKQQDLDNVASNNSLKAESLADIRARQVQELMSSINAGEKVYQERIAREEKSWADDEEINTLTGQVKQGAASAVEGTARLASDVGTLPFNIESALIAANVSEEAQEAYKAFLVNDGKYKAVATKRRELGEAILRDGLKSEYIDQMERLDQIEASIDPLTEEQLNILDSESNYNGLTVEESLRIAGSLALNQPSLANIRGIFDRVSGETNRQVMDRLMSNLQTAEGIDEFFNKDTWFEGAINQLDRGELQGDLKETYQKYFGEDNDFDNAGDVLSAAAMIVEGTGDLISNPGATFQYVAENLPQLLGGAFIKGGLATTNVGYALDEFRQGMQETIEETGTIPSKEQSGEMLAWSLSLAAAEQLGDATLINQLKKVKPKKGVTASGVDEGTKIVRDSLIKQIGKRTGSVGKSFVGEGLTEAYQTTVENTTSRGRDLSTADPEETFVSGMIGAGSGAGTVAPVQAAGAVKDVAQNRMQTWAEEARVRQEKASEQAAADKAALDEAMETGQFEQYATGEQEITNNDESSPESVENPPKVDLKSKVGTIAAAHQELVANATEDQPVDLEQSRKLVNGVSQTIQVEQAAIESLLDKIEQTTDKRERAKLDKEVKQRRAATDEAMDALMGMRSEHVRLRDMGALVDKVNTAQERSAEFKIAGQEILESLQISPEAMTLEQVEEILSSPHWTESERNQLNLHVKAERSLDAVRQRTQLKTTENVQNDVIDGGNGFRGAEQYRSSILSALDFGNDSMVQRQLSQLRSFTKRHRNKAKAFSMAHAPYARKANEPGQSFNASQEERTARQYVESTYKTAKGKNYNVTLPGFIKLVDNVEFEAQALENTLAYIESVIDERNKRNTEASTIDVKTAETTGSKDANLNSPVDQQPPPTEATPSNTQGETEVGANVQTQERKENTGEISSTTDSPVENSTEQEYFQGNTEQNQSVMDQELVNESAADTEINVESVENNDAITNESVTETTEAVSEPAIQEQVENSDLNKSFVFNRSNTNILHNVGQLADVLKTNIDTVTNYLEQDDINELEEKSIRSFGFFIDSVSDGLQGIFKVRKSKDGTVLTQIDPAQNFADENGNLTEEATTAIAASVYNWIATRAGSTLYNDDYAISTLLNIEEGDVTFQMREIFGEGGVSQTLVARALGADIVRNLGLTNKDKSVPANHLPRLEQAMGNLAVAFMRDQGIVESFNVEAQEIDSVVDFDGSIVMLKAASKVNEVGEVTLSEELLSFAEMEKQSNYVVGRLFETTFAKQFPSLKPITETVTKQKGTVKKVAEKMQKILQKHQGRAHQIAGDTDGAFMFLTRQQQEEALGIVSNEDIEKLHVSKRKGAKGKQRTQRSEIDNYAEFRERMLGTRSGLKRPFYFAHEIWKNQRIGMKGNVVNTQRSKIHRGLIRMNDWVTQIDPNNKKQQEMFLLGVAQGIGIGIDKMTKRKALDAVETAMSEPVYKNAIDALIAIQDARNLNEQEVAQLQKAIVEGIKAGKEGTHTLHALSNYARMQAANGDKFTSDLWLEVDGITNGPIIGAMQFMPGAKNVKSILARGGVFLNSMRSYGEFKERGYKDNYENLAAQWNRALYYMRSKKPDEFSVADRFFTVNRSTAKAPLMTTVYGAGKLGIVNAVADEFIENVLTEIQDIVNAESTVKEKAAQLKQLNDDLNKLTNGQSILPTLDPRAILEENLNYEGVLKLRDWVSNNHGVAVMSAIEREFSEFMTNRTDFNKAINHINEQFVELFTLTISNKRQELLNENIINKNDDLPIEEIDAIVDQLQGAIPGINNAFSVNRKELIQLAKQSRYQGDENYYKVETALGRKVDGVKSINSTGSHRDWNRSLGVAPAVISIHSLDAAIALQTMNTASVLGVHDGFGTGVLQAEKTSKTLNKVFHTAMKQMSLGTAAYQASVRARDEMIQFAENNGIKEFIESDERWNSYEKNIVLPARQLATKLNSEKNQLIDQVQYVTQYNLEESGYSTPQTTESEVNEPQTDAPQSELGTLAQERDSEALTVVEMVLRAEETDVNKVIDAVLDSIDKRTAMAKLLAGVREHVGDANVQLVDPDSTNLPDNVKQAIRSARAVYDGNTHTVYVKSTSFRHHGMSAETITHELIHATVNRYLEDPAAKRPKAVKEAIENLDALMTRVKNDPVFKRLYPGKQPMIASIDEFIAWGLTNEGFQNYLKSRSMETKGKRKMPGFRHLINAIQKILFGKSDNSATNKALYELIEDAGVIMSEARNYKPNNLDYSTASQEVEQMTSEELFESLGNMSGQQTRSSSHIERILELQKGLVNTLEGVLGKSIREMEDANADHDITFIKHLKDGTNPFVSSLTHLFGMSYQEAYVAEQLEATLGSNVVNQGIHSVAMKRLWTLAKAQLQPEDFLDASGDMELAQARYHRLFTPSTTDTVSGFDTAAGKDITANYADYLQAFTIMAMVHEPTRKLLEKVDTKPVQEQMKVNSFADLLSKLRDLILETISRFVDPSKTMTGTLSQQAEKLMSSLALIEHKKRMRVLRDKQVSEHSPNAFLRRQLTGLRNRLQKPTKSTIGRAASVASKLTDGDKADAFIKTVQRVRNRHLKERNGFLMDLTQELFGETDINSWAMRLMRWSNRDIDQQRKQVKDSVREMVRESFGRKLTENEEAALTRVMIMTDVSSLLDHGMEFNDIIDLIINTENRDAKISDLQAKLLDMEHGVYYVNQARALGLYMVDNASPNRNLAKNAHNIAMLFGDSERNVNKRTAKAAMPLIDQLATLRALTHLKPDHISTFKELALQEKERSDGNGVSFVMYQHKAIQKDAFETVFDNNPVNVVKGYMHQIVNPHLTVQFATTPEEVQLLKAQGYRVDHTIRRDRYDPSGYSAQGNKLPPIVAMVVEDGGIATRLAGIMSYTNKSAMGTSLSEAMQAVGQHGSKHMIQDFQANAQREIDALHNQLVEPVNGDGFGAKMLPIFDHQGNVQDYRYEMEEKFRSSMLEKRYDVSDVMGSMASNLIDKVATKDINEQTISGLFTQYRNDPDKEAYIAVGKRSSDPKLREIWNMLPDETKKAARDHFDGDLLMIRRELITPVFGYRKASISDLWAKEPMDRNAMQAFTVKALEMTLGKFFGDKLVTRLRQAEAGWQEIMRAIKDILVIKNVFTLVGNVISNFALLSLSGVPMKDIVKNKTVAWKGVLRYQKEHTELYKLQSMLEAQPMSAKDQSKTRARIAELQDSLANNPVKELIDAGLFQTIVEDIETGDDPFSYKSKMFKKFEKFTDNVPQGIKNATNTLFMGHDTAAYKFLNQSTQVSDFAARYAQYKYYTERAVDPLSKDEAIKQIVANFVNYDVPTGKGIQYLNDMGLLMFTKYYLRIQRPVIRLIQENPARALGMLAAQGMFGFSAPTDSSFFQNNPLSRFVDPITLSTSTIDEIATINAIAHGTGIK